MKDNVRRASMWALVCLFAAGLAGAKEKKPASATVEALTARVNAVERSMRLSKFRYVIKQSRQVEAFAKKVERSLKKKTAQPNPETTETPELTVQSLTARLRRARGISVIRAGGEWTLKGERVRNGVQREQSLRYAYWLLKTHPIKTPRYEVWFAEALARLPIKKPEALTLLRGLNAKRLIRNGWGYAALARMEAQHGKRQASRDAMARCKQLTSRKNVCVLR